MDTKQLTTFITLSQTLNYQKAAEQLQYAPSTLFKHVQLLEAELGVPLLCKTGRQLQLTMQGEAFLSEAQKMMEHYYMALESVGKEESLNGSITIGGCEINTGNSLLGLFERFSKAHPETHMNMMTAHNAGVPGLVKNDLVDVGFYYSAAERVVSGLRTVPLYREPVEVMVPWDHPLAQRKGLTYEALTGMTFIYPHDTCCFVADFLPRLERRGVHLGGTSYPGGVQLVIEQVHRTGGMTLVPHCAVQRGVDMYGLAKLDLLEAPIWAWEQVVYKNYDLLKPAARTLVRNAILYAQELCRRDKICMPPEPAEDNYADKNA